MILENHYGITISDEESEGIVTFNDLSSAVIRKLKDKGVQDLINTTP